MPPELCTIVMSPISVGTCYAFSFASAIMHRIESFLIASSLKKSLADYIATTEIPTIKVTLVPTHYQSKYVALDPDKILKVHVVLL